MPPGLSSFTLSAVLVSPSCSHDRVSVSCFCNSLRSILNSFVTKMPLPRRPSSLGLLGGNASSSLSRSDALLPDTLLLFPVPAGPWLLFQSMGYDRRFEVALVATEPKSGPKRRTNGARSMGRQAHMIPALASITDHIVAGTGPQVGSGSFADLAIVVAR